MTKEVVAPKEQEEHLSEIVDAFNTAMLATHDEDGELRARPLSIADRDENGTLWFVTGRSSGKVFEIKEDSRVAVVLQEPSRFVSLTGRASSVPDRKRIRELWKETWRPWFPDGPNDPDITALRVVVTSAEYWDLKGLNGLRYVTDAVVALAKGARATDDASDRYHGKTQADVLVENQE